MINTRLISVLESAVRESSTTLKRTENRKSIAFVHKIGVRVCRRRRRIRAQSMFLNVYLAIVIAWMAAMTTTTICRSCLCVFFSGFFSRWSTASHAVTQPLRWTLFDNWNERASIRIENCQFDRREKAENAEKWKRSTHEKPLTSNKVWTRRKDDKRKIMKNAVVIGIFVWIPFKRQFHNDASPTHIVRVWCCLFCLSFVSKWQMEIATRQKQHHLLFVSRIRCCV